MVLFGILALMLFGAKLPEVARKLGGTLGGLKRSVDDFKREFQAADIYEPKSIRPKYEDEPQESQSTAPKFKPPQDDVG